MMQPGEAVIWNRVAAGGYGFSEHVPAVIVRVTGRKVTIDAALDAGGSKRVSVDPKNISPRKVGA
jgi:hypothetical protein